MEASEQLCKRLPDASLRIKKRKEKQQL
jgi:hypothetical protein